MFHLPVAAQVHKGICKGRVCNGRLSINAFSNHDSSFICPFKLMQTISAYLEITDQPPIKTHTHKFCIYLYWFILYITHTVQLGAWVFSLSEGNTVRQLGSLPQRTCHKNHVCKDSRLRAAAGVVKGDDIYQSVFYKYSCGHGHTLFFHSKSFIRTHQSFYFLNTHGFRTGTWTMLLYLTPIHSPNR